MTPPSLRWLRAMVGKILYWVAVVVISLAILVALILFFESRDESTLEAPQTALPALLGG